MDIFYSIMAVCAILGINFALINMLNNNLKDIFRAELKSHLDPINEKLSNHITDTDKKIDSLTEKVVELEKIISRIVGILEKKLP